MQAETDRANNPASAQNHDLLQDTARGRPPIASIRAPTLLVLPDAGHGVERTDWAALTSAILAHTAG